MCSTISTGKLARYDYAYDQLRESPSTYLPYCDQLQPEIQRREARIQGIYDELEILWSRLSMPEDYADTFTQSLTGITDHTIQAVGSFLPFRRADLSDS